MKCIYCEMPIRIDGMGTWVDNTGGDVCCDERNENRPHWSTQQEETDYETKRGLVDNLADMDWNAPENKMTGAFVIAMQRAGIPHTQIYSIAMDANVLLAGYKTGKVTNRGVEI